MTTIPMLRRGSKPGDEGLSLVELMVVIAISAVVGALAYASVVSVLRVESTVDARSGALAQLQLAVDRLSSQVRSANVISLTPPTTAGSPAQGYYLVVYTQADAVSRCSEWEFRTSDGELVNRSWPTNWRNDPAAITDWSTVADGLVNNYSTGQLPFASAGSGRAVAIDLRADAGNNSDIRVTTQATGRNTSFNYPADICSSPPPR